MATLYLGNLDVMETLYLGNLDAMATVYLPWQPRCPGPWMQQELGMHWQRSRVQVLCLSSSSECLHPHRPPSPRQFDYLNWGTFPHNSKYKLNYGTEFIFVYMYIVHKPQSSIFRQHLLIVFFLHSCSKSNACQKNNLVKLSLAMSNS